ncbi:response regulator transcription factor [Kerstersia similis]|uniref:response regulator transcription factor n=1 Tax=Kerstersia similis TaxID=206505 RepID=UPI0039EFC3B3
MKELLIADDHPLFREALRGVVARAFPEAAIFEADKLEQLYDLVDAHPDADVLLLDLDMPGAQGFGALAHVRAQHPQLPIVIVSAHEEPAVIRRALDHGAMGFIPKSANAGLMGTALTQVMDGTPWVPEGILLAAGAGAEEQDVGRRVGELTPQQFRVLQMVGAGRLNKQIADDLGVSEATVKAHMTAIMRKLGVSNRTQAVSLVARLGLAQDSVENA